MTKTHNLMNATIQKFGLCKIKERKKQIIY